MRITVIVPTRERCDTLGPALRTLTQQRYDNLQILISDNASTDSTAEVVRSFADPRIRYVNTGRRLPMSANWEFALSHVDEGYVTVIGDDDGLLPDAVAELAELIAELRHPSVLGWTKAVYYWPGFFDEAMRNLLTVPLSCGLQHESSHTALTELMHFARPYGRLPGLYNSLINVELVRAIAQRSQGSFFHSSSPDVYSAIALTAAVDSFAFSRRPYGIGGQSAHSTGSSNMNADQHRKAYDRFISEGNLPFHGELVMAPSLPIITAEGYLQVRDHYAPKLADYDLERTLEAALADASVGSYARYAQTAAIVRQIAERNGRAALATQLTERHPHRPTEYETPIGYNPLRRTMAVRANDFGAHDVYEASLLARHMLDLHRREYFTWSGIVRTTLTAGIQSGWRRLRAIARAVTLPRTQG